MERIDDAEVRKIPAFSDVIFHLFSEYSLLQWSYCEEKIQIKSNGWADLQDVRQKAVQW